MRFLVTGVPGTGKTVLARKISKAAGAKLVDVNSIIDGRKLFSRSKRGEKLVDVGKLEKVLKKVLRKEKNFVAESHLLCEMRLPCDRIFVLRCEPLALKKRLEKRGYPGWKVKENVVAELLDYCSIKAGENYAESKIVEVDFTRPLPAERVLAKGKSDRVDWMKGFARVRNAVKGFWV